MKRILVTALLALAASVMTLVTRADTLNLTLSDSSQTVVQGTTDVPFYATVSNPSTTDSIYLNACDETLTSTYLMGDNCSDFDTNAPLSLAPGASSGPFELFAVNLAPNTPVGTYSLNDFQIQGGPDGGTFSDFSDLADAIFSVTVTSPVATPEPSTLLLLALGLLALGLFGRAQIRRTQTVQS
jgi:hypothetical protein